MRGGRLTTTRDAEPERRWIPPAGGRPLTRAQQDHYAPLLGFELSQIRIHDDPSRTQAAAALAYSIGSRVVAGTAPLPATRLGHELAHIAQWRTHGAATGDAERAERNADRIGADLAAGRPPREPFAPPAAALQRDRDPDAEAAALAGLALQLPARPIFVDASPPRREHDVVLRIAGTPPPQVASIEWIVERVHGRALPAVVFHATLPSIAGTSIMPTYPVSAADRGTHQVTARLRDDKGAVVHTLRGSYEVTTDDPKSLADIIGQPEYVDSFTELAYDPDFQPDRRGSLSYWVGVRSAAGWTYVDTRDVKTTGSAATTFSWRDGRVFPAELNAVTTPNLLLARRGVEKWMDDYNALFILGAFVSAVFPILTMVPTHVGPMPGTGTRTAPRGGARSAGARTTTPDPAAPPGRTTSDPITDPAPPARTTPEPASPPGPAATPGRPKPPTPDGMGTNAFGTTVMRWGRGDAAARARMSTLSRVELQQAGVTRSMAEQWRDFYRNEMLRNPANPSAAGRADLMQRAVELLQ